MDGETTLDGTLERIVFRSEDTGFTVGRLAIAGAAEPVTVVGSLLGVAEGTPLKVRGTWSVDKKWGRQFKVETYVIQTPATAKGIERFLAAADIPGVGPALAKRLVEKFGLETLAVIEKHPERLTEVVGIGTAKATKIAGAWGAYRHVQDVMVFLHGHGVSGAVAARIVKKYGNGAVEKLRENPYRVAAEVWGIGFKTADAIAEKLGIARDAPDRLEAGLARALAEHVEDGHTHVRDEALLVAAGELLGVEREVLREPLAALGARKIVVREVLGSRGACTSLATVYAIEREAA